MTVALLSVNLLLQQVSVSENLKPDCAYHLNLYDLEVFYKRKSDKQTEIARKSNS